MIGFYEFCSTGIFNYFLKPGKKHPVKSFENIYPKIVDSITISAKVAPLCVTDQNSFGVCAE
jgi:hypothetical protein